MIALSARVGPFLRPVAAPEAPAVELVPPADPVGEAAAMADEQLAWWRGRITPEEAHEALTGRRVVRTGWAEIWRLLILRRPGRAK